MSVKSSLNIDLSFDQILQLVKQLPVEEQILLSKELEKEGIENRLNKILAAFQTNDLNESVINSEAEKVRQEIYDRQKH